MKLGLALGGGGARGLAHILALEALDDCGLKPSVIAGTSMGALVGALYASGRSGREIRAWVEQISISRTDRLKDLYRKKSELVRWMRTIRPAWKASGLFDVGGFICFLLEELQAATFADLKIPLRVVATDFHRSEAVVFSSGNLLPALQASMSIPGVFVPVQHEGRVLVDGGVVNNLPYDLLLGECDATIAIDVAPTRNPQDAEPPNLLDATLGMFDILVDRVTDAMLAQAQPTLYVRPRLAGIRTLDFRSIDEIYRQAEPAMTALRRRLEKGLPAKPTAIRL